MVDPNIQRFIGSLNITIVEVPHYRTNPLKFYTP